MYNDILKARKIADKAISIFQKTYNKLAKANETLGYCINYETAMIEKHSQNIYETEQDIKRNNAIMSKLEDFICPSN